MPRKSTKSTLTTVLEGTVPVLPRLPSESNQATAYILDGMAVVQKVKSAGARMFGDMASQYYETITSSLGRNCNCVDVVFDRYDKQDSKKESERRRGSSTSFEVAIASGSIPVPAKWNFYFAYPLNMVNLQNFLAKSWTEKGRRLLRPDIS